MEQNRDSSMEPSSAPILQPKVYEDKMPELEEASHPERSGEEHKHIRIEKKTHFNRETVFGNGATEASMTVDELPTDAWLRILSVLMLVLFLVWIFPFLVKLCMRFSRCPVKFKELSEITLLLKFRFCANTRILFALLLTRTRV